MGHAEACLVAVAASAVVVDEEVVFDVFNLDPWATLSAWSQAGNNTDDVQRLVEDFREQGCCSADDVCGLELESVAGPVPLLKEPAEDKLTVGVRSRDDVGGVGRTPTDTVFLDVWGLDDDDLAPGRVDLGVLDAVEGEGSETGTVEDGVRAREVGLADVGELFSHEGDGQLLEVSLEVGEEEWAVEVPRREGDAELGAGRKLCCGDDAEVLDVLAEGGDLLVVGVFVPDLRAGSLVEAARSAAELLLQLLEVCVGVFVPGKGLRVVWRDAGEVPAGPRRRVVDRLVAWKVFSDDGDACRGDACLGDEAVGGVEADDAGSKHDDVGHGAA